MAYVDCGAVSGLQELNYYSYVFTSMENYLKIESRYSWQISKLHTISLMYEMKTENRFNGKF